MIDERDQIFYHIYPLGLCGAPRQNDLRAHPQPRLDQILPWVDHMHTLGVTSLYLGPVFESSTHGYDTADFYTVDRRLGTNETLAWLVKACHQRGIRVLLDGVFHHVGRDFWAFRDLQTYGENSAYRDWFTNVRFGQRSPYGDAFSYDGWNGHHSLVKLNLSNPDVKAHLFGAIQQWVESFSIDGLRLDAADYIDHTFLRELSGYCRSLRPDFWLLGEVIHGDYRNWANSGMFHSVTNYECYKGLFSSHNDRNYFEIAYSLNRQFGIGGIYQHLPLYAFADNHDVPRIASTLKNSAHLYPLYALLFTIPGVPSIYYGSEWGIAGIKQNGDDGPLRPQIDLARITADSPHPELLQAITRFAQLRRASPALRRGSYQQIHVAQEQLVFARQSQEETMIVAINSAVDSATLQIAVPHGGQKLTDLLNGGSIDVNQGQARVDVPATWARVFRVE